MTKKPAIFSPEYNKIARDFIDFVNVQVGAYMDACSGFAKNKSIVQRQIHRSLKPDGSKRGTKDAPQVVATALEDPTKPDVLMHRISLVSDYISANSVGGANEQHHARAAVTFLYAYWDEEVRPSLARALDIATKEIVSDIFGDLRLIRHAVLHNKGVLTDKAHQKMKLIGEHFSPNELVSLPNTTMHQIFVLIKKDMARRILDDSGVPNDISKDVISVVVPPI